MLGDRRIDARARLAGASLKLSLVAIVLVAGMVMRTGVTAAAGPTSPTSAAVSYTVQDGDSLLTIAIKLSVPTDQQSDWIAAIVALNGLESPDKLASGQVLSLPGAGSASTQSAPAATSSGTAPIAGGTYKVQDGDSLLGIAFKLGIPTGQQPDWTAAVVTLSNLGGPDQLASGQTLTLPASPAPAAAANASASLTVASLPVTASMATSAPQSPPPPLPPAPPAPPPARTVATPPGVPSNGAAMGIATPYSDALTGNMMGCMGAGRYDPNDPTVIALGPAQYDQFPCGTRLEVCGPTACMTGTRKDACPACSSYSADLSRAGFRLICGPNANSCSIRIRAVL